MASAKRDEIALKERELDQQRQRMEEQRRQWEYNAARAALNCLPELIKITQNTVTDNEDKIWAARKVCFGKPPWTGSQGPSTPLETPKTSVDDLPAPHFFTEIHTTAETPAKTEN